MFAIIKLLEQDPSVCVCVGGWAFFVFCFLGFLR